MTRLHHIGDELGLRIDGRIGQIGEIEGRRRGRRGRSRRGLGMGCGDDAESKQHSEAGPKAWQANANQEILRVVRGLKGAGLCRWLDAKSIDRTSLTWTRGENAA